jgi:hypothetical protein
MHELDKELLVSELFKMHDRGKYHQFGNNCCTP